MNFDLQGLADNVNRYIVTPLNAFGVSGFIFDVEGETTVNLTSEITDHYLEDNSTVQDHIAIKPKKVTLKSYVGELVYNQDNSAVSAVQSVARKLTALSPYIPALTQGAQQAINARQNRFETGRGLNIRDALSSLTVNKAIDYWSFVKNLVGQQSRQQQAYAYFKALQSQKLLVSVQTPFEYMSNMAIESITAIQGEESKFISDFSVTLKEIRTASILNVPAGKTAYVEKQVSGVSATVPTVDAGTPLDAPEISAESLDGRAEFQYQKTLKLGPVVGTPLTQEQQDYYYDKFLEEFKGTGFENGL